MYNLSGDELYKFMVSYLNNVLAYSKTHEDNVKHILLVWLKVEYGLIVVRVTIFTREVTIFRYSNVRKKYNMNNQDKNELIIIAIKEWYIPNNLKELIYYLIV